MFLLLINGVVIATGCDDSTNKRSDKPLASATPINSVKQDKQTQAPANAIKGDFNGDGSRDYAWLVKPAIDDTAMECIGACVCYIKFSDSTIAPIKIEPCIGGDPANLGDLNRNGGDEIGLLPDWFTSCWHNYKVFTFKNKQWTYAVDPFPTHCSQWEDSINPIRIDPKKPGNVIISYSVMTDADLVVKTKSVPIR